MKFAISAILALSACVLACDEAVYTRTEMTLEHDLAEPAISGPTVLEWRVSGCWQVSGDSECSLGHKVETCIDHYLPPGGDLQTGCWDEVCTDGLTLGSGYVEAFSRCEGGGAPNTEISRSKTVSIRVTTHKITPPPKIRGPRELEFGGSAYYTVTSQESCTFGHAIVAARFYRCDWNGVPGNCTNDRAEINNAEIGYYKMWARAWCDGGGNGNRSVSREAELEIIVEE